MLTINFDLNLAATSIDSKIAEVDDNGILVESIAKLCVPPIYTSHGRTRYNILGKLSIFGQSADGVIQVENGGAFSVTLIFDLIEFFESSILESKILKACEKSWNMRFTSNHPSIACLSPSKWGEAIFLYDPKQGDLSLEVKFASRHNKIIPAA